VKTDETLETFTKHLKNTLNHCKHMQHPDKILATCVKHMQHTDKHVCNIRLKKQIKYWEQKLAT
jgi:hypothetical protein